MPTVFVYFFWTMLYFGMVSVFEYVLNNRAGPSPSAPDGLLLFKKQQIFLNNQKAREMKNSKNWINQISGSTS